LALKSLRRGKSNKTAISILEFCLYEERGESPFSMGKDIALPFGNCQGQALRVSWKNLHPSGSIFPENLDNPGRAILFALGKGTSLPIN
jgi:hypothetical protein